MTGAIGLEGDQHPRRKDLTTQVEKSQRDIDTIAISRGVEEPDQSGELFVEWFDTRVVLPHQGRNR